MTEMKVTYSLANLNDGLRTLIGILRVPACGTQIDNILKTMLVFFSSHLTRRRTKNEGETYQKHETETAGQVGCLNHQVDASKVGVHHGRSLLRGIETGTNGAEQTGQTLDLGFIGDTLVVHQLLNTLVHNTLCKHAKLVQFTNELDETKTTTLSGGSDVVFVRHHCNL